MAVAHRGILPKERDSLPLEKAFSLDLQYCYANERYNTGNSTLLQSTVANAKIKRLIAH